jgi:acetyltransferase-like isoleucine patch superfamily enzyme
VKKIRFVFLLLIGLMPSCFLKNVLFRFLGYNVSASCKIGICLFLRVSQVEIGRDSQIANFNVFRDLESLYIGEGVVVGSFNWMSVSDKLCVLGAPGTLHLGSNSSISSRHYIDATGGFSLGSFSAVAGVRSVFFTHYIDFRENRQAWKGITIGRFCLLNSSLTIAPGVTLADKNVVGMGTVLFGNFPESNNVIFSNKIEFRKNIAQGDYFSRLKGPVV